MSTSYLSDECLPHYPEWLYIDFGLDEIKYYRATGWWTIYQGRVFYLSMLSGLLYSRPPLPPSVTVFDVPIASHVQWSRYETSSLGQETVLRSLELAILVSRL